MRPRPHPLKAPPRTAGWGRPFPRSWYDRAAPTVARELLGQTLLHRTPTGDRVGRIVETEAYGPADPANHAYRGPTVRNASMFLVPGTLYVYRIHQVCCANAVTRRGEAVLLRAAVPLSEEYGSASGPGRLCRAFALALSNDGGDLTKGPVQILSAERSKQAVVAGPRVGITRAMDRRWRFALAGEKAVSTPKPWGRSRAHFLSFAQL